MSGPSSCVLPLPADAGQVCRGVASVCSRTSPRRRRAVSPLEATTLSSPTTLLPFQPISMSPAQLAAVSYLARYSGRTHNLYAFQLRRWFSWCESNGLGPLIAIRRAHVELYVRHRSRRRTLPSGRAAKVRLWYQAGTVGAWP